MEKSKKPRKKPALFFGPGGTPFESDEPWTIRRVSATEDEDDGYSDANSHTIFIARRLSKSRLAEVAIHEGLHAEFYDLSEHAVDRAAKHLRALLEYLNVI